MKKMNQKGVVLLPLALVLSMFVFVIYVYVVYKDTQLTVLESNYSDSLKVNATSGKQSLLSTLTKGDRITNTKLNVLGVSKSDAGTEDAFGIIDNLASLGDEGTTAIENTVILDKIITNRVPQVSRYGGFEPDKRNNVFELDLTNFLNTLGSLKNQLTLNDLKIRWGTQSANTPDLYVVMTRIRKNSTIKLDSVEVNGTNSFEYKLSTKKFGQGSQYSNSNTSTDNLGVEYKRFEGGCTSSFEDRDIVGKSPSFPYFLWCKQVDLEDILSSVSKNLDLANYNYKVFLVFAQQDGSDASVPFKVYSEDNGTFGVGNLLQGDITLVGGDNVKTRVIIHETTKNNILPYLIYSLWTKGKIILPDQET